MLPTLYKQTKTGAVQQYRVWSILDQVVVEQGQVDGLKQTYYTTCQPKNLGKSNETTGAEQAILEAKSKWEKKLKQGYSENPEAPVVVQLPMKVSVYQDHLSKVQFPAIVAPKLNGVNALYRLEGSHLTLYSRGGEVYPALPHLEEHIRLMMGSIGCTELNGELYIHGEHLQDIMSAVKKTNSLSKHLEFHIFAVPDRKFTYAETIKVLKTLNIHESRPVKCVPFSIVSSHQEIEELHEYYKDYEGVMVWNQTCEYKYNQRSLDVFKYKKAQDAEFKIVGHNVDKNSHPVFVCITKEGREFKVKPKGTSDERAQMLRDIEEYLGQWLKVEFETYSKDGIPLKPVGLGLRACNEKGEPIE